MGGEANAPLICSGQGANQKGKGNHTKGGGPASAGICGGDLVSHVSLVRTNLLGELKAVGWGEQQTL